MSSEEQGFRGEITYNVLFEIWKDNRTEKSLFAYLKEELRLNTENAEVLNMLMEKCKKVSKTFLQKYRKSRCSAVNLRYKYKDWLLEKVLLSDIIDKMNESDPTEVSIPHSSKKAFLTCSSETKRKRVEHLLRYSSEELAYATQLKMYSEGRRKAAKVVKDLIRNLDNDNIKLLTSPVESFLKPKKITPNEALAICVQNRLSKFQYLQIRKECKNQNADIFPGYDALLDAKKSCYPHDISISEDKAGIGLQSIIDLSTNRIFTVQKDVLSHMANTTNCQELKFQTIIKWGCDGAAGFNSYKQKFMGPKFNDSFLFEISFVIINIRCINNNKYLWINPKPSAANSCRPIKILFCKESASLVETEVNDIESQISNLIATTFELEGVKCTVKHKFYMTMIDGKVCSFVTKTSCCNCYVCGAKPSQMNTPPQRPINHDMLSKYGISSLHAWIKCMECILHISYRLELKNRLIRKKDEPIVEPRIEKIKENFINDMGLKVDTVKQGFGNYNDGNTARRFFDNYETTAKITGVDEQLIRRIGVLLKTISSGFQIDNNKLKVYAYDTAKIYNEKYNWYFMPVTLHKILFHAADISNACVLPIGLLSEEALESRHKDAKRFREHNTRKFSRTALMEDLFHALLYSSDPVIVSLRHISPVKREPFNKDMLSLLKEAPADMSMDDIHFEN